MQTYKNKYLWPYYETKRKEKKKKKKFTLWKIGEMTGQMWLRTEIKKPAKKWESVTCRQKPVVARRAVHRFVHQPGTNRDPNGKFFAHRPPYRGPKKRFLPFLHIP